MATEDFSTYTEVDENSDYTVTAPKIDITSITRASTSYVYDDKGAAHFAGDFDHNVEYYVGSGTTDGERTNIWAMSNDIGDQAALDAANVSFFCASMGKESASLLKRLYEYDGSTEYIDTDNDTAVAVDTLTYATLLRDEAVGTYGTLYFYHYTDSGRTTLVSTQSITLHSSTKDFQYVYGTMSDGRTGTNTYTGYVQDLDLQETSGPANIKSINGLAIASIKSINGVAIASVKSWNGLA